MKRLVGKKAVVTGGARGIGLAITERLAEEGADLIIVGMNEERGLALVADLKSRYPGEQLFAFKQVDVSKQDQVKSFSDAILAEHGTIDILVNNAGITRDGLLMKMSEIDWDDVLDTNLKSVYLFTAAFLRSMMKKRSGSIINISSVVGITGNAGQTNYAASKAGVIGFTQSLAQEVGSRSIRVNCVAPGFIDTDMTQKLNEEQKKAILQKIPLARLGEAKEVANLVLFLASDESEYITGQTIACDGGMT